MVLKACKFLKFILLDLIFLGLARRFIFSRASSSILALFGALRSSTGFHCVFIYFKIFTISIFSGALLFLIFCLFGSTVYVLALEFLPDTLFGVLNCVINGSTYATEQVVAENYKAASAAIQGLQIQPKTAQIIIVTGWRSLLVRAAITIAVIGLGITLKAYFINSIRTKVHDDALVDDEVNQQIGYLRSYLDASRVEEASVIAPKMVARAFDLETYRKFGATMMETMKKDPKWLNDYLSRHTDDLTLHTRYAYDNLTVRNNSIISNVIESISNSISKTNTVQGMRFNIPRIFSKQVDQNVNVLVFNVFVSANRSVDKTLANLTYTENFFYLWELATSGVVSTFSKTAPISDTLAYESARKACSFIVYTIFGIVVFGVTSTVLNNYVYTVVPILDLTSGKGLSQAVANAPTYWSLARDFSVYILYTSCINIVITILGHLASFQYVEDIIAKLANYRDLQGTPNLKILRNTMEIESKLIKSDYVAIVSTLTLEKNK